MNTFIVRESMKGKSNSIKILISGIILTIFYTFYPFPVYAMEKDGTIILNKGWFIQSSIMVSVDDSLVCFPNKYTSDKWYQATVPSTVMGTLVNDKVYKDVFIGDNLKRIPSEQFQKPWWYRTEFNISAKDRGKTIKLDFDGIIYRADIWLNGTLIAKSDSVKGVYRQFEFNISNIVKAGKNFLAVKVFPPQPGDPSTGFVDWNPASPDKSLGIWREVKIKISGSVSINNPFVRSKVDLITLKSAELSVSAELANNTGDIVSGVITGEIDQIKFSNKVELAPNENKLVIFSPEDFPQLKIHNPRLWWTYNLGKPELYNLKLEFSSNKKISDKSETKFGIREVSDYINEQGHRGYKLNGKKILALGGGWVDDIFFNEDYNNLKHQIEYVKQMGLNTIRLEGIWGETSRLFDLCDENGILIMAGWSCQWEWTDNLGKEADEFGGIKSPEDIKLISESWKDQVKWLRNHPSIFVWLYGSDLLPRPELENKYLAILKEDDPDRPFIASAHEHVSAITGKTAVKMRGPYDYVPPVYWWTDTALGGAFGFNTELGPGGEVPPFESVEKMIPKEHLWPIDSVWNYHCGKNVFGSLVNYNNALFNRLGKPDNVEEYCTKAQLINYENTRAMFEASIANKYRATGVIHWMLNAAWPKLWWQLYDYYLMPGGAFFGTKKACEPVHILYDYNSHKVLTVNNSVYSIKKLTAKIRIFNLDLFEKYSGSYSVDNLTPDSTHEIMQIPEIKDLSKTYFIDLKLYDRERIVSSNFYCLPVKQDELDTAKATWYITPVKEYADMTDLNKLEKINLSAHTIFKAAGEKVEVEEEVINNTKELAFQVVLSATEGKDGPSILPVFWEDNYFSILPGEKRTIKGYFYKNNLAGKKPVVQVSGWNIK